jgi:nitrite reductase/ring-hydroxylating ferredoxin subunit
MSVCSCVNDLSTVFVVKDASGELRAFENCCPHARGPLNMLPDRFFARDGSLVCTRHGAKFSPVDGHCFHGPCAGKTLHALPIEVCDETGAVCATIDALRTVCEEGGGAYVLRDADSPEAQGDAVQRPAEYVPRARRRRRAAPSDSNS